MSQESKGGHMLHEADIGSGEKAAADHETEKEISKVHDRSGRVRSDKAGDETKEKGLIDQDKPFPPKGN